MRNQNTTIGLTALGIALVSSVVLSTAVYVDSIESTPALITAHQNITPAKSRLLEPVSSHIIAVTYQGNTAIKPAVLGETTPAPYELTPEQISDISNPSVVRIFNYITGSISIPDFRIDMASLNLIPLKEWYTEDVEVSGTGSGFFVTGDGYLLTNAHVISTDLAIENFIAKAADYYAEDLIGSLLNMTEEQKASLGRTLKEKYGEDEEEATQLLTLDLEKNLRSFVTKNMVTEFDQKITVLNPSSRGTEITTKKDLVNLIGGSIPARVIDFDKSYLDNHKDVGLIKIEESSSPALTLNTTSKINTGQKIFVIGYPGNAAVDNSDYFSSTMTEGSVGSLKKFGNVDVYQTDAKISQGSSGGPVLDRSGKVIGMITYVSSASSEGDNFAYALPIQFGRDIIAKNNVTNEKGNYADSYMAGLTLASQNLCRKANEQFYIAKQSYGQFAAHEQVQKYIDSCDRMIIAGNSLDSFWDKTKHDIQQVPIYAWAGLIAIIGIIIGGIFFWQKMHAGPLLIEKSKIPPAPPLIPA